MSFIELKWWSARQAERIDPASVGVELVGDHLERGATRLGPGAPGEPAARRRLLAKAVGGVPSRDPVDHSAASVLARSTALILAA